MAEATDSDFPMNWKALLEKLVSRFGLEELRTICFDLGVEYEDWSAKGKQGLARELVLHLRRTERIPELLEICRQRRPSVAWSELAEATESGSAAPSNPKSEPSQSVSRGPTMRNSRGQAPPSERRAVAFMSYAHSDDENDSGRLTRVCERLAAEVHAQTGEEFPIFQDRSGIEWGERWRTRIEKVLNEVTFLIPIITPSYFNRPECRQELEQFLRRESQLQRKDLILPVYYIDCPLINDEVKRATDDLAQVIGERQYADWRELRFKPIGHEKVRKALVGLAVQIRSAREYVSPSGTERLGMPLPEPDRRARSWPSLWQHPSWSEAPAIVSWLKDSGTDLQFNPFGPDRAEEDARLLELCVIPPSWERMIAGEPTAVFGADGTGKTASLRLLAHTCATSGLSTGRLSGEVDTFPVRLTQLPRGKSDQIAVSAWRLLTRALAQANLDFLSKNPGAFAETPPRQQRALGRLFDMHRAVLGHLATYLEGAGLDSATATNLASGIQRAAQGTEPPASSDEGELLALVGDARLSPFERIFVLAEAPSEPAGEPLSEDALSGPAALIQMSGRLAECGVYLKLCLPASLKPLLMQSLTSRVLQIDLVWEPQALREMLEQRVQQANAPSFRALFRRLPQAADAAGLLVEAAIKSDGPPRRLIQLGQALLREHMLRAPSEPKLRLDELHAILEKAM